MSDEVRLQMADVKTLEVLAETIKRDSQRGGLNSVALRSIVEILQMAIGAPLMWPSRVAGAEEADRIFPGDPSGRHAFNWGVKWAVERYCIENAGRVTMRGEKRKDSDWP